MSDLVERLRWEAKMITHEVPAANLIREAADTIENLEKKLEAVREWVRQVINDPTRTNDEPMVEAARSIAAALQEEDTK